jgi:hypothetical protein
MGLGHNEIIAFPTTTLYSTFPTVKMGYALFIGAVKISLISLQHLIKKTA